MPSTSKVTKWHVEATRLLKRHKQGNREAFYYLRLLPRYVHLSVDAVMNLPIPLSDIQDALAVHHGYQDWASMVETEALKHSTDSFSTPTVSAEHLTEYADRGIINFKELIPSSLIEQTRDNVYTRLEKHEIWINESWNYGKNKSLKLALRGADKSNLFKSLLTKQVQDISKKLLNDKQVVPLLLQLLFTPPNTDNFGRNNPDTWIVPPNIWHTDYPRLGTAASPGTQMFAFLDQVDPGGGGTLLIAGSHRLLNDKGILQSKSVKRRLSKERYFQRLFDKTDSNRNELSSFSGRMDNVPLEAIELTGNPGDVYFADLRLLHSLAANTSKRPRIMVTQRLITASVEARLPSIYRQLAAKKVRQSAAHSNR